MTTEAQALDALEVAVASLTKELKNVAMTVHSQTTMIRQQTNRIATASSTTAQIHDSLVEISRSLNRIEQTWSVNPSSTVVSSSVIFHPPPFPPTIAPHLFLPQPEIAPGVASLLPQDDRTTSFTSTTTHIRQSLHESPRSPTRIERQTASSAIRPVHPPISPFKTVISDVLLQPTQAPTLPPSESESEKNTRGADLVEKALLSVTFHNASSVLPMSSRLLTPTSDILPLTAQALPVRPHALAKVQITTPVECSPLHLLPLSKQPLHGWVGPLQPPITSCLSPKLPIKKLSSVETASGYELLLLKPVPLSDVNGLTKLRENKVDADQGCALRSSLTKSSVIRRVSRPHVAQMLADDQQFFLMVQLCYAKLLLVNTPRIGFISFGRHHILKHNLVDLLRQHSHTFDKAYEDLMRAVIDCNKSSNLRANYRFNSPATAQFSLTFSPFPIEDYTGKENVGKNDLNPGTIGSQIGVALPFQKDKEGQLSDRDVVNCHILLIEVANFTNTFSRFTACPYAGTCFFLAKNERWVLNIIHSGDWGGKEKGKSLKDHPSHSAVIANKVGDAVRDGKRLTRRSAVAKFMLSGSNSTITEIVQWVALSAATLDLWRPSISPEGSSVSDGNCWVRSVEDKAGIQTPNMMSVSTICVVHSLHTALVTLEYGVSGTTSTPGGVLFVDKGMQLELSAPTYAYVKTRWSGWIVLGGALQCITRLEARLFALGHFSYAEIQLAFILFDPTLILAYIGQAAYLSKNHQISAEISSYFSVPERVKLPVLLVFILSAVVGSQAITSGMCSIINQSQSLSSFPRVKVVHTSKQIQGQVHISEINWSLMAHNIVVLVAEVFRRVYLRNDTPATRGEIARNFIGCVGELLNLHGARYAIGSQPLLFPAQILGFQKNPTAWTPSSSNSGSVAIPASCGCYMGTDLYLHTRIPFFQP